MGAAAALIPGIVGIAGGEYAGYKKRQQEAADDAGFMAGARQLATGGAGESINPILGRGSPQMADRNAIIGQMASTNPSIARAMVANELKRMGETPAIEDQVNLIKPSTGEKIRVSKRTAGSYGPEWLEMGAYTPQALLAPSQLSKLLEERNKLSPGDPNVRLFDQAIEKETAQSGETIEMGADGTLRISRGGGKFKDQMRLTTPNTTAAQTSIMQTNDSLARLATIGDKFKPEYLELGTRWGNMKNGFLEKAGFKLSQNDQKELYEFKSFARDTSANLNQIIKDITGATVGEKEAPRLYNQVPMIGSGLFDGDGPTEFKAKYDATVTSLNSAKARQYYALQNGLSSEQMFAMPLDSIPNMIRARGNEIAADLTKSNPSLETGTIQQMVKDRLRKEYGL